MSSTVSKSTATSTPSGTSTKAQQTSKPEFLFDKTNYAWMIAGVILILLGMFLMVGGKSQDPNKFLYDEIYSFRRITFAPVLMMIGFAVEVYAIMKKPSERNK